MDTVVDPEALQSALERLRRRAETQADVDLLAGALMNKTITVMGSRGVGIGTAQDCVVITGDSNNYKNVEITFNGPQAGAIRMAIGRAQLQNAEQSDMVLGSGSSSLVPAVPPGSILIVAVGSGFTGIGGFLFISFLQDSFFAALPLLIFIAIGVAICVKGIKQINKYRSSTTRSFPCQIVEKRENGTVGFFLIAEEVNRSRNQLLTSRAQGEEIAVGDVGVALIRSDVLQRFTPFDL
jgi:hypothetical protein